MARGIDIRGQRFGRLVAISPTKLRRGSGNVVWWVVCDCNEYLLIAAHTLRNGHTQSCGCWQRERVSELFTTHGMLGTPEYTVWKSMIARCHNPNTNNYEDYGGRGIQVCDRWRESFENFYEDMGPRPRGEDGVLWTLDRIDCNGPYSPDNCRWADLETQNNNKNDTHWVEFRGEKLSVAQWERKLGMPPNTLSKRLNTYGWPIERALTTPVRKCKKRKRRKEQTQQTNAINKQNSHPLLGHQGDTQCNGG
jgi:hypothetical protein